MHCFTNTINGWKSDFCWITRRAQFIRTHSNSWNCDWAPCQTLCLVRASLHIAAFCDVNILETDIMSLISRQFIVRPTYMHSYIGTRVYLYMHMFVYVYIKICICMCVNVCFSSSAVPAALWGPWTQWWDDGAQCVYWENVSIHQYTLIISGNLFMSVVPD